MLVPRWMMRLAALGLTVLLASSAVVTAAAQDATPTAGQAAFPIIPNPTDCQVEPRSPDELLALWYTPEGSPVPPATPEIMLTTQIIPIGPRADAAAVAAVTATVREVFGCFAAGDFPRATALFSDDLARGFGPEAGVPIEEARAFLEATPGPEMQGGTPEQQIVAITDVMELSDGRVGAIVVDSSGGQQDAVYAIFAQEGDRWLVDEIIDFAPVGDDQEAGG